MDFDEYDYLEKAVEESNGSVKKEATEEGKDRERSERRRERSEDEFDQDDKERKRSTNKSRSGERERDRDTDRERDRQKSSRHRSRERDSERRSSRDNERDGGRDRRDGDREKEKERERRERERERERRSRSRSRLEHEEREREENRRYKVKKEAAEPEADPERDQRTVFAYQMPLKASDKDVYEFFSKAGKVRDVRLIMDRNSRRSKGVGYVEFYDAMSVPMAIALCGHLFLGQPIMVKPSEAEKNLVPSTAATASSVAGPYGATDRKLYVGNLHFNMTEVQLKQIFEAFGPVELVQLPLDLESGHCKGFAFIQFQHLEHAKAAQSLNGKLEIAGRTIKVSSVTDQSNAQESGTKTADFDDDEGGGLALNAQSRAMLMAKLDRSGTAPSVIGTLNGSAAPAQPGITMPINPTTAVFSNSIIQNQMIPMVPEPIGTPSECLLLKNMFDPAAETEPEFDLDIRDDVEEECSNYGLVKHIHVDRNSAGYVYLRFDSIEAASRAQQAMHKRWFAGRMISAIFLQPYEYDAKFKGTA